MQDQSPGITPHRLPQVGGLPRYLRPLGSTSMIAALSILVVAAGWLLHGMGPATLATAEQVLAPGSMAALAVSPVVQKTPMPAPPSDPLFENDPPARPDFPAPASSPTVPPTPTDLPPPPALLEAGQNVWLHVTAYCPCSRCCGEWAYRLPRRFADGTPVSGTDYALAADTDMFPFGTRIRVPGYASGQPVSVLDIGSAVKGRHIEIFFHGPNAHRRARQWGNRWMEVKVLDGISGR